MMLKTVRHRILTEMAEALAGLTVATLEGVIVLDVDAAAAQQASGSPEWVQVVSSAVKAGKIAVEMDAGPDISMEGAGSQGGESRSMVDRWKFDVVLACHLPDPLPEDGDPKVRISPERMADLVSARIYQLCGTLFPTHGLTQCGRWFNLETRVSGEPVNMPLAIRTDVIQKGGVGLSSYGGTRVTIVVLEVHYRTQAGQPEVPL